MCFLDLYSYINITLMWKIAAFIFQEFVDDNYHENY